MANTTTDAKFIGVDALTELATQIGKNIVMGPAYSQPELLERMGIEVISGIQFKRIDYLLVRKGGTTRRKVVGTPLNNTAGFLREREMECRLTWSHFKANVDEFSDYPLGTDSRIGTPYPISEAAVKAILATYCEDLLTNLFFGDVENEGKGDELEKLSLFNGFHTYIAHDIADGIISEANGNLVECDAISVPTDADDSTPFDTVFAWYSKWNPRLRQQAKILLYCDHLRGSYIASGYANKFHGNVKVNYLPNGNFTVPEMPRVEFVPSDVYGTGDRLMATIPNNLQYGVDTLSNQTFVGVRVGSDEDMQEVQFQVQSKQGVRLMNPLASAFCMSNGSIEQNVVSGDYENALLTVAANDSAMGTVTVNGEEYTEAQEFAPNSIITLKATANSGYEFVSWSNGKTDAEISIVATGMPMAITAIFQATA